jgi:hypothetical protein
MDAVPARSARELAGAAVVGGGKGEDMERPLDSCALARSRSFGFLVAVLAGLASSACAGSGGRLESSSLHLGRGTARQIHEIVPLTLNRFGYSVARFRETPSSLVFETEWKERGPLEDEAGKGIEAVRTRFTVEARRVGRLYSVWLRAENTVWEPDQGGGWHRIAPTPMFQEQVASLSRAIEDEIDTGLRVY